MQQMTYKSLLILSALHFFILICPSTAESVSPRILIVGEELKGGTLQLKSGERIYKLICLREKFWYEIPAIFSIELRKDLTDLHRNNNRRLLNIDKLIFKAERSEQVHILVTVNAEGVVAQPNVQERELVLFNIGMRLFAQSQVHCYRKISTTNGIKEICKN